MSIFLGMSAPNLWYSPWSGRILIQKHFWEKIFLPFFLEFRIQAWDLWRWGHQGEDYTSNYMRNVKASPRSKRPLVPEAFPRTRARETVLAANHTAAVGVPLRGPRVYSCWTSPLSQTLRMSLECVHIGAESGWVTKNTKVMQFRLMGFSSQCGHLLVTLGKLHILSEPLIPPL